MSFNADTIITRLRDAGFEAYPVGGCIRDEELEMEVLDVDITTNATPDEIADIFKGEELNFVGKRFGVMIVNGFEVATFRSETYNVVGKPDVTLVKTLLEDLSRRDFTMNAMAKDQDGNIIDHFGGREDIRLQRVKAVGDPLIRFQEDPSRILRGLYFASYLNFDIEKNTRRVMKEQAELLEKVPIELVGKILLKVIKRNALSQFLLWLKELDLLEYVFPYLVHTVKMLQNPKYHNSDVFGHIVRVIQSVEKRYPGNIIKLLSALFHDVAKGLPGVRGKNGEGQPNDLRHEEKGVPIAKEALQSLQFNKKVVDIVLFIVEYHGLRLPEQPSKRSLMNAFRKFVPYFSNKKELIEGVTHLFEFMKCDADGFEPSFGKECKRVNGKVWEAFQKTLEDTIFYRSELPVDGRFIMQFGFQGEEVGDLMKEMVEKNLQTKESIQDFLERKVKRRKKNEG